MQRGLSGERSETDWGIELAIIFNNLRNGNLTKQFLRHDRYAWPCHLLLPGGGLSWILDSRPPCAKGAGAERSDSD